MTFPCRTVCALIVALIVTICGGIPSQAGGIEVGGEWDGGITALESLPSSGATMDDLVRIKMRTHGNMWRLYADTVFRQSQNLQGRWTARSDMERLLLKVYLESVDLNLGRQPIDWAVSRIWSPVNPFQVSTAGMSPEAAALDPWSVLVRVPVGPLSYWSFVGSQDDNGKARYGVQRRGHVDNMDWSGMVVADSQHITAGAGFKGDLLLGVYGEGVRVVDRTGGENSWEGVLGADYSWYQGKLVWAGEYFYHGAGAAARPNYDVRSRLQGDVAFLGRQYLSNQLTLQYDDFTSMFATAVTNLVDGSDVWTIGLETLLSGGWKLSTTTTQFGGDPGDEFSPRAVPALGGLSLNPERVVRFRLGYRF